MNGTIGGSLQDNTAQHRLAPLPLPHKGDPERDPWGLRPGHKRNELSAADIVLF